MTARRLFLVVLLVGLASTRTLAQAPVDYRLTFPAPEHRWMQVEVTFPNLPAAPLEIRMSRTSPGRYALHEFAKNVFDVRIRDGKGTPLVAARPDLHQWTVSGHDGTVVVTYRVFGDRTDGTYLSVDATHAHLNMPASLMWARGLELREARVRFEQPPGRQWRVATQLYPTSDPLVFTAPNFHYLMDSPAEFSAFALRTFSVPRADGSGPAPTFRIALHHDGTDADADAFARDTETIVRETLAVFGEFPAFENDTYTFLSDYLPWASGDGMEHRNSTVLSSQGALRNPGQRLGLLGTVAHEFFHAWNMERIRAKDLEPFDFEHADVSGELWFGEGFTSYYDELLLARTGLAPLNQTLASFAGSIGAVSSSPGRRLRTAEEMSRLAPFVDAAAAIDRTSWDNTFISYYTYGAAIGLALDLSLRDRSDGRVTLDDYMRALWAKFGRPGQQVPGMVATPYTMTDLRQMLAEVSGDRAFAETFFTRFVQGHDVADYQVLLARAGFTLRPRGAGAAVVGAQALNFAGGAGARVASAVMFDSPLYVAGVDRDDLIVALDGVAVTTQEAWSGVLKRHKPGDRVELRVTRRSGEVIESAVVLEVDPRLEIVPVESGGTSPTDGQQRFRLAWLGSGRSR
ncbi:MAG: M61 family metallopeptidase [Acidobacteriota bacterium]